MNRSIPIIAIQLNAAEIEGKITLQFTKVLDIYEPPEDEEGIGIDSVDRSYWENKSNSKSIKILDELIGMAKEDYENVRITYNKYHVAIGTVVRNFMWLHPRKTNSHIHMEIKIGKESFEWATDFLENKGLSFNPRSAEGNISLSLHDQVYNKNKETIKEIIRKAISLYS